MSTDEFETIRNRIATIQSIADSCSQEYRVACFSILLQNLFQGSVSSGQGVRKSEDKASSSAPPTSIHPRAARWLTESAIGDRISEVLDLESGQILTTRLGANQAAQSRTIAALMCVHAAMSTGEFKVPKEAHRELCRTSGALDASNYAATMRNFTVDGRKVFLEQDSYWVLAPEGMRWATECILGAIGS